MFVFDIKMKKKYHSGSHFHPDEKKKRKTNLKITQTLHRLNELQDTHTAHLFSKTKTFQSKTHSHSHKIYTHWIRWKFNGRNIDITIMGRKRKRVREKKKEHHTPEANSRHNKEWETNFDRENIFFWWNP